MTSDTLYISRGKERIIEGFHPVLVVVIPSGSFVDNSSNALYGSGDGTILPAVERHICRIDSEEPGKQAQVSFQTRAR